MLETGLTPTPPWHKAIVAEREMDEGGRGALSLSVCWGRSVQCESVEMAFFLQRQEGVVR